MSRYPCSCPDEHRRFGRSQHVPPCLNAGQRLTREDVTSERGLTHAEAMDAIFERFFRRSPEAGYSFAEFKADAMTILEATAAAEQRLRERIEAQIEATTIAGKVEFRLSHSEWRVPVQAVWQWLSALLVTPPSASPRQGEEDEVEPCNIEPAFSQHEYAVDYCETHDRPADQCAPSPASPRQGEPVELDANLLGYAMDLVDEEDMRVGVIGRGRKVDRIIAKYKQLK